MGMHGPELFCLWVQHDSVNDSIKFTIPLADFEGNINLLKDNAWRRLMT
jgi:hypothetical protein|eukprot:COSAG01_NODE_25497_length_743_cov_0.970497_1_plen_49_part_00